jgi:ubiquinone/menaquinone biosynthesis C-methylase UbiE
MAGELTFRDEAAAEYDRAFAHVTAYFMPFLLRAAHLAPGMRVLDIATGTGLSAEAALAAVGPTGHVTAADVSPDMAGKARERLMLAQTRKRATLVAPHQAGVADNVRSEDRRQFALLTGHGVSPYFYRGS